MTSTLLDRLAALSAAVATQPEVPQASGPAPATATSVLADRPDGTVVRTGHTVAKAHAPDSDTAALATRLRIAAHPSLHGILLPPLPVTAPDGFLTLTEEGRALTRWPYGSPVPPDDPDGAPWEEAAVLLARLHAVDPAQLPGPVPPMRGPAKAARAIARLRAALAPTGGAIPAPRAPRPAPGPLAEAAGSIEAAWALLPPWARGAAAGPQPALLCHGDLHLGQLVRHPATGGRWLLIDIDDLGLGDPAWDLARPAAWFATGLLAPDVWARFLSAYRTAGGRAVRPDGDPWPDLEIPARTLTVQTAALAVAKAAGESRPLDEIETAVVDACARMTSLPRQLAPAARNVG